jgi:hypothetical protein
MEVYLGYLPLEQDTLLQWLQFQECHSKVAAQATGGLVSHQVLLWRECSLVDSRQLSLLAQHL